MNKKDYKAELIFSIILFASFFLPYIKLGTLSMSGYQVADNAKSIFDLSNLLNTELPSDGKLLIYKAYSLYLIPALSALAIIFFFMDIDPKLTSAIAGVYVIASFIYCFYTFEKFLDLAGIGVYLSLICGIVLLISAFIAPTSKTTPINDNKALAISQKLDLNIEASQNVQNNNPNQISIQEWKIQNPTKSINDYYKDFGS